MKKFLFTTLILAISLTIKAQQISAFTISIGVLANQNIQSTAGEAIIGTSQNSYWLYSGFDYLSQQQTVTTTNDLPTNKIIVTNDKIILPEDIQNGQIVNINGQIIKIFGSNTHQIDIKQLTPGIYLIIINSNDNTRKVTKFVKL
jgi:hypothetical protein